MHLTGVTRMWGVPLFFVLLVSQDHVLWSSSCDSDMIRVKFLKFLSDTELNIKLVI